MRLPISLLCLLIASSTASAECNIANLLFGKVRVELIPHTDPSNRYETGIIFGNDFDSKRFSYDKILGRIDAPERDGSRRVSDANMEECARIQGDLTLDTSGADCASCSKAPIRLLKVGPNSLAVMSSGQIMGTIEGRLPRSR